MRACACMHKCGVCVCVRLISSKRVIWNTSSSRRCNATITLYFCHFVPKLVTVYADVVRGVASYVGRWRTIIKIFPLGRANHAWYVHVCVCGVGGSWYSTRYRSELRFAPTMDPQTFAIKTQLFISEVYDDSETSMCFCLILHQDYMKKLPFLFN